MIKQIDDKTTEVTFEGGNKATIGVSASIIDGKAMLTLRELLDELDFKKGETFTPEDVKDLPKMIMQFSDPESIDVVIKVLRHLKEHWNNQMQYVLAC